MKVPEEKYPFKHRQDIQVRFNDMDVLGHVNNTVYLEYMDLGKAQYITTVLGKCFDFVEEALVIASINCDFYHITVYGEPLTVLTRIDDIGIASVTLEQRVVNSATNQVKCIARSVMVGYNIKENAKMDISDQVRDAVGAYEGRSFPKPAHVEL